ncbi:hypothetical protein PVAG01_06270 [Phlyctema vagabunda]|uniref:BAH domain-containing protein n=1 Tax=Phlyctema vagabunda TaxID=108571 RepID=A0ABR4PFQ6_9HELO
MDSTDVRLDREESQVLEEELIFLSKPTNGKRKVSAALLSPPSTSTSHSSIGSSNSSAFVQIEAFDPSSVAPFYLPESAESVAALEFIGLTRRVAGDILASWVNRPNPDQNPNDLFQYVVSYLGKLHVQPLVDLPAPQAMMELGISSELQTILLNPRFTQMFRSETLHFWLVDTFKIRYSSLNRLLRQLKSRAIRTIAKRRDKKRPKIAGVFDSGPSSSAAPQQTAGPSSSGSDIPHTGFDEDNLPSVYLATQTAQPVLEGHYLLYKGKSIGDIGEGIFLRDDGSVNMFSIETHRGGDFNHRENAWYFTKQKDTGEQYRLWGADRCKWAASWLITIQVPKTFMDSLPQQKLFYSPDWKEYIWYCRKSGSAGNPPAKFDKFWKAGEAQMVEGHICGRAPSVIPRIKKEEVQQRISESDVMQINGVKCTQVVFMNADVIERMAELVRRKINIKMHKPIESPKGE